MGTTIRGKTQVATALGTEAIPVETAGLADGFLTAQQIANLAPASSAGLPVYNVKASPYNATGNGTTDDKTAIQTAINACQSAGGGIVFFPPGTYFLGSGLLISGQGVVLQGAGPKASIIRVQGRIRGGAGGSVSIEASSFDAVVFSATSGSPDSLANWADSNGIRDISIRRDGGAISLNRGLDVAYQQYFLADNVLIYNFGVGYDMGPSQFGTYNKIVITGYANEVNPTLYGFNLTHQRGGAASNRFTQCTFTSDFGDNLGGGPSTINDATGGGGTKCIGWYVAAGTSGRADAGIQDLFVANSESTNATYGLYMDGTGTGSSVECFDVHFDDFSPGDGGTGSTAVYITNVTSAFGGAVDFNGGIATNPVGFSINASSGITIRGVQFINNTTTMVQVNNSTDVAVSNCIMRSSGGTFVTITGSSYCTVANNLMIGSGFGVWFPSGSSSCTVTGNTMRSVTASHAVDIGAGCTSIVATGNAWGGVTNFTNAGGGTNNVTNNV